MLRRRLPFTLLALASCAAAPPPPSVDARDPSNPRAEETPLPVVAPSAPPHGDARDAGATVYACPMHPDVTAREPGQRCPKCGMGLVPRSAP